MKSNILGGLAVSALLIAAPLSTAFSADMAVPAPAPFVAPTWSGFYIGANGGWGEANAAWNFPVRQFFASAPFQNFSTNTQGGMFGGHFGYNGQFGSLVLGAEITADWLNLKQTLIGPVSPAFPNDSWTTKVKSLETVTGRVGFAPGNWLYYAKFGIATGRVQLSALSGAPVPGVAYSDTESRVGGTVGAGVEWMWTPHFILGVEYDYVGLMPGSFNGTGICTTATCGAFPTNVVTVGSNQINIQTVVGRVSYKF